MGPQTCRIWNLGMIQMTIKLYTLPFTWKYAFQEAACFKGLFWTHEHEQAILSCILEAGISPRSALFQSTLGQLKCKVKDISPPISVKEENWHVFFCSSVNSSLIREGWRFFFISSDHVLWHYTQFTRRVMFTLGVGCNFFWNDYSSCTCLKFSFHFFFT